MNPRRFLNALRSPAGALTLFLLGLVIVLVMVNSRRQKDASADDLKVRPTPKPEKGQLAQVIDRNISPFRPPAPSPTPTSAATPAPAKSAAASAPGLPPLSLFAESPQPEQKPKTFSNQFAPFGRLIPCELVITVDSSSINTPIVGLVTEDIFHHGQLVIPAGTEVHGSAQVDRTRERIASDGRWTLVWQNGEELSVSGVALDHEREVDSGTWGITDGSAGLRGRLLKSDNLAEVKLYAAALLSGAADVFTDRSTSGFGSLTLPSLQNAPLKGAQSVLDRYAQQILTTIERDGFFVRVPAGKQFYLYVTQTLDQGDAKVGGRSIQTVSEPESSAPNSVPASPVAQSVPAPRSAPLVFRSSLVPVPPASRIP